ncbi:MAG: hypothetical protein ACTSPM_08770 [Candidatus Heimdallarchaeota archaeon]
MKAERVFTIGSIITFFALFPALIYMEVKVLQEFPNIAYLFIIADVLLLAFMGLEIFLVVRKWKKEKAIEDGTEESTEENIEIKKEWDSTKEANEK